MKPHNASSFRRNAAIVALLAAICCANGLLINLTASASAESFLEEFQLKYSEDTLGLEAGCVAPLLDELGEQGQRTVLAMNSSCGNDEMAVLRLVSETFDIKVVLVLGECPAERRQETEKLVGDGIEVIGDSLAARLLVAYKVGYDTGDTGIVFLIDESGQIVLRRFGSSIWLFFDDYAVIRAFDQGVDVTEVALPQHPLTHGKPLPTPPFELLDQDGEPFRFDDGTPRLIYSGLRLSNEIGQLVAADLDALRAEFPDVEFIWHRDTRTSAQAEEDWKFYNASGLAALYPDSYGIPMDEFIARSCDYAQASLAQRILEIEPLLDAGWRLAVDSDDQLKTFWCLAWQTPCVVLVVDGTGTVALSLTDYPLPWSSEWSMHLEVQDALRQILVEISGD